MSNSEQIILGRPFTVVEPKILKGTKYKNAKMHARVHVEGLNKKDGKPIRFHSVKSAENHITNFRLER